MKYTQQQIKEFFQNTTAKDYKKTFEHYSKEDLIEFIGAIFEQIKGWKI